jgi:hypothetical protein
MPIFDNPDWLVQRNVGGVVLPALPPVRHADFKDWLREDLVRSRFDSPEYVIEKAAGIEDDFPVSMLPLAEKHLPRFLELL